MYRPAQTQPTMACGWSIHPSHMATSALPTPFSAYTPFNQPVEFRPFCFITDYSNEVLLPRVQKHMC